MKEEIALFGEAGGLVGVTTEPADESLGTALPAVIILNAGILHRVGPNRIYVKLARELASAGFVTLRFDFSGNGDSSTREGGSISIAERMVQETQQAMDYLTEHRGTDRFILAGLCLGAIISFKTACIDPRVAGAILINPAVHLHGEDLELNDKLMELAMARHYWRMATSRSFRSKNWRKALSGAVDYRGFFQSLAATWQRFRSPREETRGVVADNPYLKMLDQRGVRIFEIHSEGDEGLDYLDVALGDWVEEWQKSETVRLEIIPGANHVFTLRWSQQALAEMVRDWAKELVPVFLETKKPQSQDL